MDADQAQHDTAAGSPDGVVVRRSRRGWQVGDEEATDLTSAMALADLLAAELGLPADGAPGSLRSAEPGPGTGDGEAARLAVTVAQLEHALAARVRVEQAIGVLAERHRLRPRQAFDLLRNVARSSGQKVVEIAGIVVDSASNPLLPLPEELARTSAPGRTRGPSPRRVRAASEPG
jgi:ANTAR domain